MTTSHVVTLTMCVCALAGHAIAAVIFPDDAVCVVQAAMTAEDRLTVAAKEGKRRAEGKGKDEDDDEEVAKFSRAASRPSVEPDYCKGLVQMGVNRSVAINNLGGLAATGDDPVIHIRKFVDLMDGRSADMIVSNLTVYSANNFHLNGLTGDFNNINIKAGFVDLLLSFTDTLTQEPLSMPAFNLTIYDIDGNKKDANAETETVEIDTDDFTTYKLTDSTDVLVTTTATRTQFGSSKWGILCDNPSSIETLGVVKGCKSGTIDQRDRAVAVQMKGGRSSYHLTLRASATATVGRNFLFGIPAYFDEVCHSTTQSPTPAPTTASPSLSPTLSPTGSPSSSPTASPTGSPTSSPSSSPTSSPTASPSYSPTLSPSSSPTLSPSSSPTLSPSYSPTSSPTGSPTSSPTNNVVTSFGDPHVTNLKGERFDILQTDYHTFLVIPRGADEKHALLHVVAKVDPLGQLCSGLLYVTSLRFSGLWVGEVGSLEFTTSVDAAMEAEKAMKIKAGPASLYLNASRFREIIPESLAEVTEFQPQEPRSLNQHVDLMVVKLKLGPSIAKVRMVYQKEKVGFSNSLWLTTTGLGRVHDEIGGILGFDDHTFASSKPTECVRPDDGAAALLLRMPAPQGAVHAVASFDDVDE